MYFTLFLTLFLFAIMVHGDTIKSDETASSITYFESPGVNQWSVSNPLRIEHEPSTDQHTKTRPNEMISNVYVSPMKPRTKIMYTNNGYITETINRKEPKSVDLIMDFRPIKRYQGLKPNIIDDHRFHSKPMIVKSNQHETIKPKLIPYAGPKGAEIIRRPLSKQQQQQKRPKQRFQLNVRQLVNQFQLVSMKPLLNQPNQPIQPSIREIESRLLKSPFTFYKANQMFVPINNQPFPIKSVAFALNQAGQGDELINQQADILDHQLIALINRKVNKNKKMYEMDNSLEQDDEENDTDYDQYDENENEHKERSKNRKKLYNQIGVTQISPNFYRLPSLNHGFRSATLGTIGYIPN